MRVQYHLASKDLNGVAAEAAWAESMGYDGLSSSAVSYTHLTLPTNREV